MAREVALEEMPPSSQPSIDPPSTPQTEDGAPSGFKDEMPPLEVIEAQAQELESMTPSRPSLPQTSLMEFIFAWLTPFPDDPWLNMIATCMQWCVPLPCAPLQYTDATPFPLCIQASLLGGQVVPLPSWHCRARGEETAAAPSVP